jgi:hypothetical protein
MRIIKCIVAADNPNGEPDLYFCRVRCTEQQFETGDHYDRAKRAAQDDGYDSTAVVFDEFDDAGNAMLDLFVWESAEPVTCD